MKDLPNIDPSLLTSHTKSDRNLPIAGAAGFNPRGRSVHMMPELGMGYGGAAQPGGVNLGNGDKAPVDLGGIRWQEPHAHKGIMTVDEIVAAERHVDTGADFVGFTQPRAHSHYFKDVTKLDWLDVYRVLALFGVTDPCLQHAVKKLLVAGARGAKDITKDVTEAVDTLKRWQEMRAEEGVS